MVRKFVLSIIVTALAVGMTACSSVPQTEGLELPHYDGNAVDHSYNGELFYRNDERLNGADPGAMYVSDEEIRDSYRKRLAAAKAAGGNTFDEGAWIAANGTEEDWTEEYGSKFYIALTGGLTTKSAASYQIPGAFPMYSSQNLNDWVACGAVGNGYAMVLDADPEKDWTLGNYWAPEMIRDPESGKFFLYASASCKYGNDNTEYLPISPKTAPDDSEWNPASIGGNMDYNSLYITIAIADKPTGPYVLVSNENYYDELIARDENGNRMTDGQGNVLGSDGEVLTRFDAKGELLNRNGHVIRQNTPPINFGKYVPQIKEDYSRAWLHDTGIWPVIDTSPMLTEDGELYLYFSQHVSTLNDANVIWGMKMKDMITPDYATMTKVAEPGLAYIEKINPSKTALDEGGIYNFKDSEYYLKHRDEQAPQAPNYEASVNEGASVIEHNGKYYLTYSPIGLGDRGYSVMQAIGDDPLGPFVKYPDINPAIGINETNDYMAGTGHHDFLQAGDELFSVYHAFFNPVNNRLNGVFIGRAIACDRLLFKFNEDLGFDVLYGNGPTYSLQPLPECYTGYTNVAKTAEITATDCDESSLPFLTDGMFSVQPFYWEEEFKADGTTTVTLKWDTPKEICAVMIYNSAQIEYAFSYIDLLQFEVSEKPDWWSGEFFGKAYIAGLKPNDAYVSMDENTGAYFMRQGGSAVAEFEPIKVTQLSITISRKYADSDENIDDVKGLRISEIYVMGR